MDDLRKALLHKDSPAVEKKDVKISSASMLMSTGLMPVHRVHTLPDTLDSSGGRAGKFTPQQIFLLRNGIYAAAKGLTTDDWKNHFNAMDKSHRVGSVSLSGCSNSHI